ncbi:GNAT family N-acetyltransferase [Chryseobacterium sp. CT-SW4]|uniref:GNAT family N-acetyltransferase n=1 Tax=Chryseobacterium sp. SW-1 TaxID=3157343 RepID=UPI003B014438
MKPVLNNVFSRTVKDLGTFSVFPLNLKNHIPFIHEWVNQEYAKYWQMQGTSVEEVKEVYEGLLGTEDYEVYMGYFEDQPSFLLECYHPKHVLSRYYDVEDSDYGMHILVAPPTKKINSFTWNVFRTAMEFLFSDESIQRIVVEPDIRNDKIHRLNRKAGFVRHKKIQLLEKKAYLELCTREQFKQALQNKSYESEPNHQP